MKTAFWGALLLAVAAVPSPASTVTNGTLTRDNDGVTRVQYWAFSVNTTGNVAIDVLSHSFFPTFFDPYVFLFRSYGDFGPGNLVAANDDSGATFADGSLNDLDSYLALPLNPGRYFLAIVPYQGNGWELGAIAAGTARAYFSPYDPATEQPAWTAQYQITWTGDISDVEQVPEPASALLTLIPILGLLAARRLRK